MYGQRREKVKPISVPHVFISCSLWLDSKQAEFLFLKLKLSTWELYHCRWLHISSRQTTLVPMTVGSKHTLVIVAFQLACLLKTKLGSRTYTLKSQKKSNCNSSFLAWISANLFYFIIFYLIYLKLADLSKELPTDQCQGSCLNSDIRLCSHPETSGI